MYVEISTKSNNFMTEKNIYNTTIKRTEHLTVSIAYLNNFAHFSIYLLVRQNYKK